jgi:hypothetical protein
LCLFSRKKNHKKTTIFLFQNFLKKNSQKTIKNG